MQKRKEGEETKEMAIEREELQDIKMFKYQKSNKFR